MIANILQFLGRRESKLVQKNSKKLPKLFQYGFTVNFFKQKRPECPFKIAYLYIIYNDAFTMEKDYATLHFSIILISLMVRVVQVLDFFSSCHFFFALKSCLTQVHHTLYTVTKKI